MRPQLFRDRTRSAKRLSRKIGELAARGSAKEGEDPRVPLYRRLLTVTTASLRQAQQVRSALATAAGKLAQRLHCQLGQIEPLVDRVIRQTQRRVLGGERVPASEKVLSLFEPHTALIRRGKARQPTEFGRKVLLDEVDGGIVTRYQVLAGNPPDAPQLLPSVRQHTAHFGHPPQLVAADRSFWSPNTEREVQALGVRRLAIPRRGGTKPSRERERSLPARSSLPGGDRRADQGAAAGIWP